MNNTRIKFANITTLDELEKQAIHNSSWIQPHGVILVLQEPELNIVQVTTKSYGVFGIHPEDMIGRTLEELLDPFQFEIIQRGITQDNLDFINPTK
ncbi:MAG: cyanobacterial phytochrome A, partial [Waterburya sp.]